MQCESESDQWILVFWILRIVDLYDVSIQYYGLSIWLFLQYGYNNDENNFRYCSKPLHSNPNTMKQWSVQYEVICGPECVLLYSILKCFWGLCYLYGNLTVPNDIILVQL